jgi:hypothetical protein
MSSIKVTTNLSNSTMNMEFIRYIVTISGRESGLRDIFFTDLDLIITQS